MNSGPIHHAGSDYYPEPVKEPTIEEVDAAYRESLGQMPAEDRAALMEDYSRDCLSFVDAIRAGCDALKAYSLAWMAGHVQGRAKERASK